MNLLGHLDYNLEANSQRGETMTMMTMTKMINNNNELCIILGVLHLFHHFRTTLKEESNTMMTIRQVLRLTQKELMGWKNRLFISPW